MCRSSYLCNCRVGFVFNPYYQLHNYFGIAQFGESSSLGGSRNQETIVLAWFRARKKCITQLWCIKSDLAIFYPNPNSFTPILDTDQSIIGIFKSFEREVISEWFWFKYLTNSKLKVLRITNHLHVSYDSENHFQVYTCHWFFMVSYSDFLTELRNSLSAYVESYG
jgi:hypothetical protein